MILPVWNLKSFYGFDEVINEQTILYTHAIQLDMQKIYDTCFSFQKKYKGCLKNYTNQIDSVLLELEQCESCIAKIESYACLLYAKYTLLQNVKIFYQKCQDFIYEVKSMLLFFEPELRSSSTHLVSKKYCFWLDSFNKRKIYLLSESEEKILYAKNLTGRESWIRLFDETIALTSFNGKTESEVFNQLQDSQEDIRRQAGKDLSNGLKKNIYIFTLIINTLMKDKSVEDKMRGYQYPEEFRHINNLIEKNVVDLMVNTVRAYYPRLSHRYYRLKAKLLKKAHLNYWDRLAPVGCDSNCIVFSDAKKIILDSFYSFCPNMAQIAEKFFDGYIDALPIPGKDGGAFAHPTVPSVHPFILLNYHGRLNDVMTLAHELGHGVHQVMASSQGFWGSDTPLTIAETASVFGEMLVFQNLLKSVNSKQRIFLLASKIEDMLNTVVRQVALFDFERRIHDMRAKKELTTDELNHLWISIAQDSLGDGFLLDSEYQVHWAYITHFIHTPFYVYAYAFGECLVNSLYKKYESNMRDFIPKYNKMLSYGGTVSYKILLKDFDCDPYKRDFWENGLLSIENLIHSLEMESSLC